MSKVERVLKDEIAIARLETEKKRTIDEISEKSAALTSFEKKVGKLESDADCLIESYPSRNDPRLTSAIGVPPRYKNPNRFLTQQEEEFAIKNYSEAIRIKNDEIKPLKKTIGGLNHHLSMIKFKKAGALVKRAFHMAFPGSLENLETEIRYLLKDIETALTSEKSVLRIAQTDIENVKGSIQRAKQLLKQASGLTPDELTQFALNHGYASFSDIQYDAHDDVSADEAAIQNIVNNIENLEFEYETHLTALNNVLARKNKNTEPQRENN